MKVLVIPDVHLKPWMFGEANRIMIAGRAEKAVCLGDLADNWGHEFDKELYTETYDRAIQFAHDFPDTLWCYGNHDVVYPWNQRQSGYSPIAAYTVTNKLLQLQESLPNTDQIAFIQRIDDVLFMHGGLSEYFVNRYVPEEDFNDEDKVIETINRFSYPELWSDISPIWLRPQYNGVRMYKGQRLLQVVGHTPIEKVYRKDNVISTDNFSTDRQHRPLGMHQFPIIDTETWEYELVDTEWQVV